MDLRFSWESQELVVFLVNVLRGYVCVCNPDELEFKGIITYTAVRKSNEK